MPTRSLGRRIIASHASATAPAHSKSPSSAAIPINAQTIGFPTGVIGVLLECTRKPESAARASGRP
eukprot:4727915-Pyramimonas_sp.AAC.1